MPPPTVCTFPKQSKLTVALQRAFSETQYSPYLYYPLSSLLNVKPDDGTLRGPQSAHLHLTWFLINEHLVTLKRTSGVQVTFLKTIHATSGAIRSHY